MQKNQEIAEGRGLNKEKGQDREEYQEI